jgi:hypothetical protein
VRNEDITFASPATKYILTLQNPVSLNHQSTSALHPQKHAVRLSHSLALLNSQPHIHTLTITLAIILQFSPFNPQISSFQSASITFSGLKSAAFYSSGGVNARILLLKLSIHTPQLFTQPAEIKCN